MGNIKDLFMSFDQDDQDDENVVEVYSDSIRQALDLASKDLGIDVTMLDYEILEKGTKGFFGIGRMPYKVLVKPIITPQEHTDFIELEKKLSHETMPGVHAVKKDVDGSFVVRVTKAGVMFIVNKPKGKGREVDLNEVSNKLYMMRINKFDSALVEKEVKKASGKPQKIADWIPNPEFDSSMRVEISDDEMRAYVHFNPPRYTGRHLDYDEVMDALRNAGVVNGINEEKIQSYLDEINYRHPLLAASGNRYKNGRDAYIEYKVRVENRNVSFEEDESGKVDFRNLELLENVVAGQLLAVKVPAETGVPGRTVTNRILPARSGKDIKMSYGKGTILSEDGTELTAEINGQVVFKANKLSVEPVYVVPGDVSLETGNIIFLGSVIVQGSVQDNFVVKAAGNIEVKGTVQKAFLEAEGDIIIRQGIMGRDEAKIESTGGSIYAKFIQSSNVVAENEVIVPEGIMHSRVDAGNRIYSTGRRARIVGGVLRAGKEINARFIGADVSTKMIVRVGINPKVLQQISELENLKNKHEEELNHIKLDIKTLEAHKKSAGALAPEKEKMLVELNAQNTKLEKRFNELSIELEELHSYIGMLEHDGKVCAERTCYPGVDIYIKDQKFPVKDPYNSVKFSLEGEEIKISEYEPPENVDQSKFSTIKRRR